MSRLNRSAATLLACALILPVAACAGKKAPADTEYVARDVNTLYALAKSRMDQRRYEESAKLFDEVERQHPYSVWARRAQLMSAFSYYMAQKYPEAVSSSQRFLTIHPGNKDAPYAHYLIAMSYYQQIEDVTRDQKITQQAADAFGEFTDVKVGFLHGHSRRVAELAATAARAIGCSREEIAQVRTAGFLHDVGRVAVPNGIWEKPAALNAGERERVRLHVAFAPDVLEPHLVEPLDQ